MVQDFLPKRLSQLRIERDISARDLSLSLGMNETYINKIENGKTVPSLEVLEMICEHFHLSLRDFFDEEKTSPIYQNKLIKATAGLQNTQIDTLTELARGYKLLNNQK